MMILYQSATTTITAITAQQQQHVSLLRFRLITAEICRVPDAAPDETLWYLTFISGLPHIKLSLTAY